MSSTPEDVGIAYQVFLGRLVESINVVEERIGFDPQQLISILLDSDEFLNEIARPFIYGARLPRGRFLGRLTEEIRGWVARTAVLTWAGAARVASSEDWQVLLYNLFADPAFRQFAQRGALEALLPRLVIGLREPKGQSLIGNFDSLHGKVAIGWAWDPVEPHKPLEIEFRVDETVIAQTTASHYRRDVERPGLDHGRIGFRISLPLEPAQDTGLKIRAFVRGEDFELDNSPREFAMSHALVKWMSRRERATGPLGQRLAERLNRIVANQKLSLVMPVYNTPAKWLREAIESVLSQWCANWELLCVNDASPSSYVREILDEYAARDSRIIVEHLSGNVGVSGAVNVGIAMASGDFVGVLDHDDYLEPDAVFKILNTINPDVDMIYSDEMVTTEDIETPFATIARPAFSYDYYLSHPYFVHLVCIRRAVARASGGWDKSMKISADVDFVLRCLARSRKVAHVPSVLYRWRTHPGSSGHQRLGEVTQATLMALNRHLHEMLPAAIASAGPAFNTYRVDFPDDRQKVAIIIPTKNRVDLVKTCVDAIIRTTDSTQVDIFVIDHASTEPETRDYLDSEALKFRVIPYGGPFNFSAMNNYAVKQLAGTYTYVLFMNNDVTAIGSGWLERLRSLAGRSDVGVVGATLLYGDDTIQHAGVVVGLRGPAEHAHKFQSLMNGAHRNTGYNQSLVSTRDYSAVTAACMIMRKAVFDVVGGFDEDLPVGFNDTDLCLRVISTGLKVLNDAHTVLYHLESATRSMTRQISHPEDAAHFTVKWPAYSGRKDPFYSPLLDWSGPDHQVVAWSPPIQMGARISDGPAYRRYRTHEAGGPATGVTL